MTQLVDIAGVWLNPRAVLLVTRKSDEACRVWFGVQEDDYWPLDCPLEDAVAAINEAAQPQKEDPA